MTKVKNDGEYRLLKENERKGYLIVESKVGNQLIIATNIFRRSRLREEKSIRNPELLSIDDDLLIFTQKEWTKIQKNTTAKNDFNEVYYWEKTGRFKGIYTSKTKSGIRQILNKGHS